MTPYGIECNDGKYYFEAKRLGEERMGTRLPDWPLHLLEKNWVHIDAFMEAFCMALAIHHGKYRRHFKKDWYEETKAEIARTERRYERKAKQRQIWTDAHPLTNGRTLRAYSMTDLEEISSIKVPEGYELRKKEHHD